MLVCIIQSNLSIADTYGSIVGRGVLTLLFYEDPPILPTPAFSTFVHPPPLFPTLTAVSVVLFLWLNGWSCHIWYTVLRNEIVDLQMFSLATLVPDLMCVLYNRPWCMFQDYWGLTHYVVFCWYSDLISQTQKHTNTHTHTQRCTTHSGASRLTQPYIYLHHLLCAHSSYLYYTEWIIHGYQKFTFHNVFFSKIIHL